MLNALLVSFIAVSSVAGSDDYLAGHNAARAGRYADAIAAYSACANVDGPLKPYAQLREAFCVGASGDRAKAIELYKEFLQAHADGPWVRMARTYLASVLAQEKQYAEAGPLFAEALSFTPKPWWVDSYEWAAADCFLHVPEMQSQGRDYFRNIVLTTKLRAKRLEAVSKIADSPDKKDVLAATFGLLKSAEIGNAFNTLRGIIPNAASCYLTQLDKPAVPAATEKATKASAAKGTGKKTAKKSTAKKAAATDALNDDLTKQMQEIAAANDKEAWLPVWLAYIVRHRAGKHDTATALEACDLLIKYAPESEEAVYGVWWVANRLAQDDKPESAVKQYVRVADLFPKHALAADSLFDAILLQRAQGHEGYVKTLTRLVHDYPDCSQAANAWYWLGKAKLAAKNEPEAVSAYRKAVECGIGNFYSHLALERLRELKQDGCPTGCDISVNGSCFLRPFACSAENPAPLPEVVQNADWYQRLSFFGMYGLEEAEWEALDVAKGVNGENAKVIYQALGEAGVAYTAMGYADANGWDMIGNQPGVDRLRVRWPRAYWPHVQKIAKDTGVDPYFILAIARQESTYRPALTSHAGASGVMQIMPGTAKDIVKWECFDESLCSDLENPMTSLRMGACYLARVLERHDGNLAYAAASYNGGPGNCSKWRDQFGDDDLEKFIENIPFSETRDYVKKVLGNYAAYYSLYPR